MPPKKKAQSQPITPYNSSHTATKKNAETAKFPSFMTNTTIEEYLSRKLKKLIPASIMTIIQDSNPAGQLDRLLQEYSIRSIALAYLATILLKLTTKPYIISKATIGKIFNCTPTQFAHIEFCFFVLQFSMALFFYRQSSICSPRIGLILATGFASASLVLSGIITTIASLDVKHQTTLSPGYDGHFWITYVLSMAFLLGGTFQPTGHMSAINVFRNNLPDLSRKRYLGLWASAQPLGCVLATFLVSYLTIWRPWTSIFTTLGVMLIGCGTFIILHLKDDQVLDEKWQGAGSKHEATSISADNSKSSGKGASASVRPGSTFTRNLDTGDMDEAAFGDQFVADWKSIRKNLIDCTVALRTVGTSDLALGYFCVTLVHTCFEFWVPYWITYASDFKLQPWRAGYMILWYEFGGLIGTVFVLPACARIWQKKGQLDFSQAHAVCGLLAVIPLVLLKAPSTIVNRPMLNLMFFMAGIFTNSPSYELAVSEMVHDFTIIYENKLPNAMIPPFRSVETVVLAGGHLGRAMSTIILAVIQRLYIGDAEAAWANVFSVLALFSICSSIFFLLARRKIYALARTNGAREAEDLCNNFC